MSTVTATRTSHSNAEHSVLRTGDTKWKDPEFMRLYNREQARRRSVVKRHPNILPDGSKWSDHHPYGVFATKEEYLRRNRSYYEPSPKEKCCVCGCEYYISMKDKHMKSKKHNIAVEALELNGIPINFTAV